MCASDPVSVPTAQPTKQTLAAKRRAAKGMIVSFASCPRCGRDFGLESYEARTIEEGGCRFCHKPQGLLGPSPDERATEDRKAIEALEKERDGLEEQIDRLVNCGLVKLPVEVETTAKTIIGRAVTVAQNMLAFAQSYRASLTGRQESDLNETEMELLNEADKVIGMVATPEGLTYAK